MRRGVRPCAIRQTHLRTGDRWCLEDRPRSRPISKDRARVFRRWRELNCANCADLFVPEPRIRWRVDFSPGPHALRCPPETPSEGRPHRRPSPCRAYGVAALSMKHPPWEPASHWLASATGRPEPGGPRRQSNEAQPHRGVWAGTYGNCLRAQTTFEAPCRRKSRRSSGTPRSAVPSFSRSR